MSENYVVVDPKDVVLDFCSHAKEKGKCPVINCKYNKLNC